MSPAQSAKGSTSCRAVELSPIYPWATLHFAFCSCSKTEDPGE